MTDTASQKPDDQPTKKRGSTRNEERARKFRNSLSPELLLRWLVIRDGPLLPNGHLVGLATASTRSEPDAPGTMKRILESWPVSFIVSGQSEPAQADLPCLILRSLALAGLARRALVAVHSARCPEWRHRLETDFLIDTTSNGSGAQLTSDAPNVELVHIESLTPTDRKAPSDQLDWDIAIIDGTVAAVPTTAMENLRNRSRALLILTEADPSNERDLDMMKLCQRSGSFSSDSGIVHEYYRLISEFKNANGQVPEQDAQFLRRAIGEVRDLDPSHWSVMIDAIGVPMETVLLRWIRTGCPLDQGEASAILTALELAAPFSRVNARPESNAPDPTLQSSSENAETRIPSPVALEDISQLLRDTADRNGILRHTDHPDVFALETNSGESIRITASRDALDPENDHSSGDSPEVRCEFATYGGSDFDDLLALLPNSSVLPNWLHRMEVEASDGDFNVTKSAYVVSCRDGDRSILSMRALINAEVNPDREPSNAFIASLERYLRQEVRSELSRIKRASSIEEANLNAARHQKAFALEIAAALLQQLDPDEKYVNAHDYLMSIAKRRRPMLVTLDRARLSRHSPNLLDVAQAIPDDGRLCLNIPPALLFAADSEIQAMSTDPKTGIDLERLRDEVDRLLE